MKLAFLLAASCAVDARPLPDLTIIVTEYCSSLGCTATAGELHCGPAGDCRCNLVVCYTPSCADPDADPVYAVAALRFAPDGEPCLEETAIVP